MPTAAPRGCPRPRCRNTQPCPLHPVAGPWSSGARGRAMPPGWRWITVPRILARDPACRLALPGCTHVSTEVHHLRPGDERDTALAGVCSPCHKIITRAQALDARGYG